MNEGAERPQARPLTDLTWREQLARVPDLPQTDNYWEGVIRVTRVSSGAPDANASILEVAQKGPEDLIIREISLRGDYEKGWKVFFDGTRRLRGSFENLSRPLIASLTDREDLERTRSVAGALVVCPHPQWIAVEVVSKGHLPVSLVREASCHSEDPVPGVAADLLERWGSAAAAPRR